MSDPSQQPRRRRRQPATPPPSQGSIARGAVLVVVAIIVGFLLLRDDNASTAQAPVGTDTASSADDGTGGDDGDGSEVTTPTSSTVPARPASQVKVLVANGSGVDGAAGSATDSLEALGYVTGTPTNAERVPATIVYFTSGYEAEARELAAAIGATPASVAMLPAVAPVDDMQLANLLVVLGPDLAAGG